MVHRSLSFAFASLVLVLSFLFTIFTFAQEAPPGTGPQEEMIPEEAQQQSWSKAFQEAESVFNSEDQAASIPMFQNLITEMDAERIKRNMAEPERQLLLRSLDYLGQVHFLEGQQEESESTFLKLLELEPNYKMNEDLVSAKIISFVEQIKSRNLGTITVTSEPPDATVKIDGVVIGKTNLTSFYSLKGDHNLEITRPGYFPQQKTITVIPGKGEKIAVTLERSSSVAYFVTYPKGVEVRMGGKVLGVTGGDAGERGQTAATEQNLPVEEFSAEFPVADLQTGEYTIEFVKPCWETPPRKIPITENQDYFFEPIVLIPSVATLEITANDPQANIFIDNEYKGLAPKQKLQVCSGKHLVKIKGPLGKFEQEIDVKRDESLKITATLNPSLAFLGILIPPDTGSNNAAVAAKTEVIRQLSGLRKLNFQDNSASSDPQAIQETVRQIILGIKEGKADPGRKSKIQEICHKVESDLLLVGSIAGEASQDTAEFFLLSNWSSMADTRVLKINDAAQWSRLKAQLDYDQPLFQKRLGVQLIDTAVTPGAVLSEISVKTFAEAQPLQVGDIVVAFNGKTTKTATETLAAVGAHSGGDDVTLTILRSGAETTVPLKLVTSPLEVPFDDQELLFNRQMMTFQRAYSLSTDNTEKDIATLNVGLCFLHFGEYQEALNQFRLIQMNRPIGIGPGTVQYRMAQCYRELGSINEAEASLAAASRYQQNTIRSDDGPPLQREVEHLKKALQ